LFLSYLVLCVNTIVGVFFRCAIIFFTSFGDIRPKGSVYDFLIGFDKILFGMEYNTSLPDYIRNYAMSPFGGGGLFVEHHPFPHIFMPKPNKDGQVFCEAKVTLGHKVKDPKIISPKLYLLHSGCLQTDRPWPSNRRQFITIALPMGG
jgi:hypothetical protein